MVSSIRSSDRSRPGPGRLLPAFFALAATTAVAQELSYEQASQSSHGLLERRHWEREALRADAPRVAAVQRSFLSASAELGAWPVFIAYGSKAYFEGSANVLALTAAAQSSGQVRLPSDGRYSLQGRFSALRSTDIGVVRTFAWSEQVALTVRPYVSLVENYQRIEGAGVVEASGGNATVKATVQRVGTRDYGFLVQDRPDSGWGVGFDLGLSLAQGPWALRLDVDNLLSRLQFATVHYSNRQYDLQASQGVLVFKDAGQFSMTGQYGVERKDERLPLQTRWALSHAGWPGWSGGLFSVGQQASPWLAYQLDTGPMRYRAQTMGLNNLTLEAVWAARSGLSLGAGVTLNGQRTPVLGLLSLSYRF